MGSKKRKPFTDVSHMYVFKRTTSNDLIKNDVIHLQAHLQIGFNRNKRWVVALGLHFDFK